MKFFLCCILLLSAGAMGHGATNSWQTDSSPLIGRVDLGSLPAKEHFARIFVGRMIHNSTNRVNPLWMVRYLERQEEFDKEGVTLNDRFDKAFESALNRSLKLTLRQFFIEEVDFFDNAKEKLSSFAKSTISGFEEKDNLVSPFHEEEGLPTQDSVRKRRGLKFGLRPFRTSSPYAYASYGKKDRHGSSLFNVHLRYYYRDWKYSTAELVADVPLIHGFALTTGIYSRTGEYLRRGDDIRDDSDYLVGKVGIYGPLARGIVYLGTDISSRQRVVLSYMRSW